MATEPVFVVDTSVVVKWFSEEEYTDAALRIRKSYVDGELDLYAPDLLVYELTNALRYSPEFGPADVTRGVQSVFDMGFEIVTPTPRLLETATELAHEHDLTIYDATFVALARTLEGTAVTTDEDIADLENVVHLAEI